MDRNETTSRRDGSTTAPFLRIALGKDAHLDFLRAEADGKTFLMTRTPITQGQYLAVTDMNPSWYEGPEWPDHPVDCISGEEARRFCEILEIAFREPRGPLSFALPTVGQWRSAAFPGSAPVPPSSLPFPLTTIEEHFADEIRDFERQARIEVDLFDFPPDPPGSSTVRTDKPNALGFDGLFNGQIEWTSEAMAGHPSKRLLCYGEERPEGEGGATAFLFAAPADGPCPRYGFRVVLASPDAIGEEDLAKARDRFASLPDEETGGWIAKARGLVDKRKEEDAKARAAALEKTFRWKVGRRKAFRIELSEEIVLDLVRIDGAEKPYYIGRYPVTHGQYRLVDDADWDLAGGCLSSTSPDQPARNVRWERACDFCELLNEVFEEERGSWRFALPTVEEWETAARAGKKTRFAGGDSLDEVGWYDENIFYSAADVGLKAPNRLGLHDMSGNVGEWCRDRVGEGHAYRGGGCSCAEADCEIGAAGDSALPDSFKDGLGFRVVLDGGDQTPPHFYHTDIEFIGYLIEHESKRFDAARREKDEKERERLEAECLAARERDDLAFPEKCRRGEARRFRLAEGVALDLLPAGQGDASFLIGRFEVTREQYRAVMGELPVPRPRQDKKRHWDPVPGWPPFEEPAREESEEERRLGEERDREARQRILDEINPPPGMELPRPREAAVWMSWHDAIAFCDKLNVLLADEIGEARFTLPTIAQWELAAAGGEEFLFAGSNDFNRVAWFQENSRFEAHEVGMKMANGLGLYDMCGNVTEWALDGDGPYKGILGGNGNRSFRQGTLRSHLAFRRPDQRLGIDGFRVVLQLQAH